MELLNNIELNNNLTKFKFQTYIYQLKNIIIQTRLLSKKYDVVVTNPPYMGNNGMNSILKEYIKTNYPLTKTDLFAVFLQKGLCMIKEHGFNCMVTMQSWMFLSSFEKFRKKLIETTTISNLLHMDNMVMKIAFGTSATVFRKINLINYNSTFYHVKLTDVENDIVDPLFFNDKNKFYTSQINFNKMPGTPIAYWVNNNFLELFNNPSLYSASISASQNVTGNNKKYLRYFWEVDKNKINKNIKWIFYAKGGGYRKWVGNMINIIDWTPESREIYRTGHASQIVPKEYWYKKGITWGLITSSKPSFRILPEDSTFDKGGSSIFIQNEDDFNYILGLLNSNLFFEIVKLFNPTLNFQVKDIRSMPLIMDKKDEINDLVDKCCQISKNDWDDYETSWNFKEHPFISFNLNSMNDVFIEWEKYKYNQLIQLKNTEIKLNKEFCEIYNININCDVEDEDVSIRTSDYVKDIKSFVSYAVGCMFGRYSLDNKGLQFAGGKFNINDYYKFIPDDDNIIPVLDTAYFDDDIVGYFTKFVETCFGKETLEENLDFIAGALSKHDKPSREIIRDYLLKNFFDDHKKTYKKCPIYWQFSSGKQNGFNCLVYMHRYEPSLVARIRTDYLHKTQKAIEQRIANNDDIINNSTSKQEITRATKEKAKLQKQLKETQEYDEVLAHIANQNIEIDLDDGVKVNYTKFQKVEVFKEGEKTKKINILKNI